MNDIHNDGGSQNAAADCGGFVESLERLFAFAVTVGGFMEAGLVARGLTRARATVLWQVHRQGPATQRQLAQTLAVTARNVTGLVDGLEAGGFVIRAPHPQDRRATLVTLTDAGRAVAAQLEADYAAASARLFAGLSSRDVQRFTATLDLLTDRLATVAASGTQR
ncbi:MAG TPA: MarR family transcriptional regulator [Planosporangium sp.]|nr:MarR family transcriptional regulator [Planosporangium sp.]